jgi:hypothetical protein
METKVSLDFKSLATLEKVSHEELIEIKADVDKMKGDSTNLI